MFFHFRWPIRFGSFIQRGRSLVARLGAGAVIGITVVGVTVHATDPTDEDDDYPPGLVAKFIAPASDGRAAKTIERVDPNVQFAWGAGSPDARLAGDAFEVTWSGKLLVRAEGKYRFHLFVQGSATATVNGRTVVEGQRKTAGWLDGPETQLDFGEHFLSVTFTKTQPESQIRLFWSCRDTFPLEPVPPQVLFHDAARSDLKKLERGRDLFDAHRCNRCHRRDHDLASPPGPDLTRVAFDLDRGWLIEWLQRRPHTSRDEARQVVRGGYDRMPSFGFTADEAAHVVDFLHGQSKSANPAAVAVAQPLAPDDARLGEVLFRSVGCLACHTHGDFGLPQDFSGGDLTDVGRKRSFDWLVAWLADPAKLNTDHRMPVVKLSETERRRIAGYLVGRATQNTQRVPGVERSEPPAGSTTKPAGGELHSTPATRLGRRLVEAARCVECHLIPGLERSADAASSLTQPIRDWSQSCLAEQMSPAHPKGDQGGAGKQAPGVERSEPPTSATSKPAGGELRSTPATRRPSYSFSENDRTALQAFLESRRGPLAEESAFARGARLLRERNCLVCHERDGSRGIGPVAAAVARIDSSLQGLSEALIPPDLTAVGDKLHDKALAVAIRGDQPTTRMPWLRVRMPRFDHAPEESTAILAYLVGHDRIPSSPTSEVSAAAPADEAGRRKLVDAGRKLVGPQGWSCTACHRVGEFEPRNVALGTRGSNLHRISDRMRPEFFLRWTRSPLRIIPGMEMPSYEKPVAGILKPDVDLQLRALWHALGDERTPVSAELPAVEQIVRVAPGQPSRVVRDVFRLPKSGGKPLTPDPSPQRGEGSGGFEYVPRAFVVGLDNGVNLMFDLDAMALRRVWLGETARQRTSGKSWFWEPGGVAEFDTAATEPDVALRRRGTRREEGGSKPDTAALLVAKRDLAQHGRLIGYAPEADGTRLNYRLTFDIDGRDVSLDVAETWKPGHSDKSSQTALWQRHVTVSNVPAGFDAVLARRGVEPPALVGFERRAASPTDANRCDVSISYERPRSRPPQSLLEAAAVPPEHSPAPLERLDCLPGFEVVRLPIDRGVMPTAIGWNGDGRLAICSLKGHVFTARDTDGDSIEDQLTQFEEGLAAPYGIILDANGRDLLVAHKPELLRLRDTNGDGRADVREVVATGWGCSEDYHDWTFGIVRDSRGRLYLGLGSDYAKPRPPEFSRWRGKVVRVETDGRITPLGSAFRYPTGLAITADDQVFVSDNQGVQNTFNEINHLVEGGHYGVPAQTDEKSPKVVLDPAIKVPHPWTRSVNGIFFWSEPVRQAGDVSLPVERPTGNNRGADAPHSPSLHPFVGHGIGCEYDTKALVRFTLQRVGGTFQGAVYPFTTPDTGLLLGALCGGVAPNGDIYIGSIHDSGWLGGRNVGEIVRLRALPLEKLPLGIRELRATADGMVVDFTAAVDRAAASQPDNFAISGYTRKWQGAYATPDSGRHKVAIKSVEVSPDDRQVTLRVDRWQAGFVYEVSCARIGLDPQVSLWPAVGHYTMNVVPGGEPKETRDSKVR